VGDRRKRGLECGRSCECGRRRGKRVHVSERMKGEVGLGVGCREGKGG